MQPNTLQGNKDISISRIILYIVFSLILVSAILIFIFKKDFFLKKGRPLTPEEREEMVQELTEFQSNQEISLTQEEQQKLVEGLNEYQAQKEVVLTPEEREEMVRLLEDFNSR